MRAFALGTVALLAGALACGERPAPVVGCGALERPASAAADSVVLVLNDTMRRDRMGIHGGGAATPHFDRLAREHLWFPRAVSQAPWTKPSIATLFTSLYPTQHGVVTHPARQLRAGQPLERALLASDQLPESAGTLAEAYRAAGFRTAAFVANPWMDRRFGFAQGFEHYDDSFARWDVPGDEVVAAALAWLATVPAGERVFVYVHTIDTHRPYPELTREEIEQALAEPPIDADLTLAAEREIEGQIRVAGSHAGGERPPAKPRVLRRAYDKGIEHFDAALGALLHGLERDPRGERMAVIVTSDHGEALYGRGFGNHGLSLYQSELAVPLAMRLPDVGPARVDCRVGLIDLMPTLCDWSGLACPADMAGRSLFSGVRGTEDLAGRYVGEAALLDERHRAVYEGRFKLLYKPGRRPEASPPAAPWSLFDLQADPGERHDLLAADVRPPAVERTFASLRRALDEAAAAEAVLEPGQAPVDPALEERLRSLGYVE